MLSLAFGWLDGRDRRVEALWSDLPAGRMRPAHSLCFVNLNSNSQSFSKVIGVYAWFDCSVFQLALPEAFFFLLAEELLVIFAVFLLFASAHLDPF